MWDGTLIRTSQQARWIAWMIGIVIALVTAGLITGVAKQGAHPRVVGLAVFALMYLALGVMGYRALRAGVLVRRDTVVVRNFWRSTEVAWDDIDRFAVENNGPYSIGYLHRRDGTGIAMWGIQGQSRFLFKNSVWATGPIGTLNGLLAERRAGSTV
jgi:hypothetical protein